MGQPSTFAPYSMFDALTAKSFTIAVSSLSDSGGNASRMGLSALNAGGRGFLVVSDILGGCLVNKDAERGGEKTRSRPSTH